MLETDVLDPHCTLQLVKKPLDLSHSRCTVTEYRISDLKKKTVLLFDFKGEKNDMALKGVGEWG